MKTSLIKQLASAALSLFAIGSFAQCPTMSGIYALQGAGTATVAAMMTPSTNIPTGRFYWTVSPSTGYFAPGSGNGYQQYLTFGATGNYTVCANYIDSTTMCSASSCTVLNVSSSVSCQAGFSYTNDSICATHFQNTSTGTNLSYRWYELPSFTLLSTQANPVISLGSGSHNIALYTYSNNQFCDSASATVNVNCNSSGCHASFTYSALPGCISFFYSTSVGTNLTYEWKNFSAGGSIISTQSSFTTTLPSGNNWISLFVYSNGQFCDSTTVGVSSCSNNFCQAGFSYTNDSNCATHFQNTSTGTNLSYRWYELPSFTLLSTQANPVISLGSGSHNIALYTYSNNQACDSANATVNVNCNPSGGCQASFTYSTLPGCISFFYSTSVGTNLTYEWRNFSAGGSIISTQSSFTTTLPSGNNWISLFVYSNGQFCDSTTVGVSSCSNNLCQANSQFMVFADSVNAGNYFAYNQSTGSGILSYLWDFGDGSTSTQPYPFHQYATPGQYIICLTVTANNGSVTCTDISCDSSSVHRVAAAYLMNRIQVMPQGATAVKETEVLKSLSVYPNPVDQELTIEVQLAKAEKLYYVITDGLGRVVEHNELTSGKTIVNTSALDKGMYFLTVTTGQETLKTTRLVK